MRLVLLLACLLAAACGRPEPAKQGAATAARNLLLVTIDTLRADRIGAYGDRSARTPALDGIAARGALFSSAFAAAPITLPSHASLMTGRYPAGHGSRHNGMRVDVAVPTLADSLARAGFTTGAFVGAFPLDRRFGLINGFQTYGDRMPRGLEGRPANERPGSAVVDEALGWLQGHAGGRFFLWVHLFEPHAPYGDARSGGSAETRYAGEIAEADRQVARLLAALGPAASTTLVAVTSDHGEAFGEHGEVSHSLFVYDTTLRVPLVLSGPGVRQGTRIEKPVSLIDVAPTVMKLLGVTPFDADGVDLSSVLGGTEAPDRVLYAESFAPLLDFGWSPLRSVREAGWKLVDAPRPELFNVARDAAELDDRSPNERARIAALTAQVARYSGADVAASVKPVKPLKPLKNDPESAARLQALGYVGGSATTASGSRPDPKDRRELAARIARVTSGELRGPELERALRAVLAEDPRNPQANLRLGYVLLESNRCAEAVAKFRASISAHLPSADAHLGLAACRASQRDFTGAAQTLREAERVEPGNPVVLANLGLMVSDGGNPQGAVDPLQRALSIDPDLHRARFALAIAYARAGRRGEAKRTGEELLRRLPPNAPQRAEVQRLVSSLD
ncbi:MAG: sulfatase-like hydrolase/transferase [Acidobacteria bacterium]|nr:sulfatase-like hydrolase/transferase [Acidobacteriota bacterium]